MTDIRQLALRCRDAARSVAALPTAAKDAMLEAMAVALESDAAAILAANAQDLEAARAKGLTTAMLDRLRLDDARL
ncbi:MAG TPA: gamma-glutamyl-phosphate reductase, partial [Luteimonas sp.]|nr:gamma-glutamyl-phosphate reductase [Luteimonas sp.]